MLLNEQEAARVAEAIRQIEAETDAELVTVLARQADDYYYIPTLWAAILALASPGLLTLTPFWLGTFELFIAQVVVFVVFALLLRLPPLLRRIIPRRVAHWRASNLARREFLENNLHHTKGETGVLIFVAETERYVEIIVDRGISSKVDNAAWQSIVADFTNAVGRGDTLEGFLAAIERCGEILVREIPKTHDKDELPNHLVMI